MLELFAFVRPAKFTAPSAVGLALGFVLQLAFAVPLIAAEQISGTMGLAIATSIDPSSGAQSGALGTFFGLVMSLLFYAIGAHLLWYELLVESYRLLPAGQFAFGAWRAESVVLFMGYGLGAAAAMALPVVLVLLLVQVVTGLIARSAPSLNLFALGLPAGVLAGIAASRMATGADPFTSACEAVWLHGEAARRAGPAFTPSQLAERVPEALAACL